MSVIIDYPQTQDLVDYIISKTPKHLPEQKAAFRIMNLIGCRASESYKVNLWNFDNASVAVLTAAKGSELRVFSKSLLDVEWLDFMQNNNRMVHYVNYRKLQYTIHNIIGDRFLMVGNKAISTHIFRYNYIKSLQFFDKTPEQIKIEIGHRSINSTMQYINNNVTGKN